MSTAMTHLRVRFQTLSFGDIDIHLRTLKDMQQFHDPEQRAEKLGISSAQWPLFGSIWPSSIVLSHYVNGLETKGQRILEVGCGMALTSLLLHHKKNDITATDYHPEAERFLKYNTNLNETSQIPFFRADWKKKNESLGTFDLIIGSDLLYEDAHITDLSSFINRHSSTVADFILVDPGRGRKNKMKRAMHDFGFSCTSPIPDPKTKNETKSKGVVMHFSRS
jgi:predicted nicotinamide N-methyase